MNAGQGRAAFPWAGALALVTPGVALAAAGGYLGLTAPAGVGLVSVAAIYLLIDLFVLQPKLEARASGATHADAAAQAFLEHALATRSVDEVAVQFERTVGLAISQSRGTSAAGKARAVVLAPGADGNVRVLCSDTAVAATDIGDPTAAFLWLGDCAEPLSRERLLELQQFEGAAETLRLLDLLGCNMLLPLLHRGMLLGLGMVAQPEGAADLHGFFVAMRAYTTVAIANTFLDAEARGHSQLAKTFDLANTMQESLMPDDRPVRREGFELRGLFRPVDECGGDLWAWRDLADGKVLLVIADATGHGAAPALLAAVAKGTIDAQWQMSLKDLDPGKLLHALNSAIHRAGRKRYMMTAFAAVVDSRGGTLTYANAGQNFPYFIKSAEHAGMDAAQGKRVEPLIARGNSLGAAAEAHFETHSRPMSVGDKLVLYTDGITEAGTPMLEEWGEKRFRALLEANANQRAIRLTDIVMSEVEAHLAGNDALDDITMIAFEYGHQEAS